MVDSENPINIKNMNSEKRQRLDEEFNFLYDDNCKKVCAPDGGFSGAGNGNCPDFQGTIERTLVWEDQRN